MTEPGADPRPDLPEDWFARAQRALSDLQFRAERTRRELGGRELELEARFRELAGRGDQLRDAFRKAEETSQDLMARTHALREEEKAIAEEREGLYREKEEVARLRSELEARATEFGQREGMLAEVDRRLKEREAAIALTEREVESLRDEQGTAMAVARAALARERELAGREGPEEKAHVTRMLELRAMLEAATVQAHSREGQAHKLLSEAAGRAAQVHSLELQIREQEARLAGMRLEIVNAKQALLTVDRALTQMPYEVVDDFTRSEAFEAYERAVRALKRFEAEAPADRAGTP